MDTDKTAEILDAHPDFRVLCRLRISDGHVFAENVRGEACGRLAVIDTETAGLKAELGDRIIDLAIATCEYGRETGRLYRVGCKNPKVIRQTALERYRSLAARADTEADIWPRL